VRRRLDLQEAWAEAAPRVRRLGDAFWEVRRQCAPLPNYRGCRISRRAGRCRTGVAPTKNAKAERPDDYEG